MAKIQTGLGRGLGALISDANLINNRNREPQPASSPLVSISELDIDNIVPNPYQPRRVFSQAALEELSNSIKSYGILQPITVRDINGNYELVAGERRFRAAKLANLQAVPAIINNMTDESSAVLALLENLQREDLNFIEEAMGYENLIKEHSFTQQQLAEKLGKNQSTIANKLRILRLPMEIKIKLVENDLTERHARALLRLEPKDILPILNKIIEKKLSISQSEELVEAFLQQTDTPKRSTKRMFSDVKIFLNTINHAVDTMQKAGIKADIKRNFLFFCMLNPNISLLKYV